MARKKVSKPEDPFYIEQDEESGQLFSKETLSGMLDMGKEEPYQDKLLVTDKYGELKVIPLPAPLESTQARPAQSDLGSGRPEPLPRTVRGPGAVTFDDSDEGLSDEEKSKFADNLGKHPADWYGVFVDFIENIGEVPQELVNSLPSYDDFPSAQDVLDEVLEDVSDFESGRPQRFRTKKFKPPLLKIKENKGKKFNPKLMETYGGTLKKLGQYAQK